MCDRSLASAFAESMTASASYSSQVCSQPLQTPTSKRSASTIISYPISASCRTAQWPHNLVRRSEIFRDLVFSVADVECAQIAGIGCTSDDHKTRAQQTANTKQEAMTRPRKLCRRRLKNFGLRGSVSACLAGTIAVSVTHPSHRHRNLSPYRHRKRPTSPCDSIRVCHEMSTFFVAVEKLCALSPFALELSSHATHDDLVGSALEAVQIMGQKCLACALVE